MPTGRPSLGCKKIETSEVRTADGVMREITTWKMRGGEVLRTYEIEECCDVCGGEGVQEVPCGRVHSATLEQNWKIVTCEECGGSRVVTVEVECDESGGAL